MSLKKSGFTALIDFDSILYQSVYRIVSFSEMREAIVSYGKEGAKQWILSEVYERGINRTENMLLQMQNHLEMVFPIEITEWRLYLTTCKNNFRHKLVDDYKAKRKKNKYVWLLREHYVMNGAICSDELEADDLIYDDAKKYGFLDCLVISIDKDLKQIGGYFWSYYKQNAKDIDGNFILNEYGNKEKEYKQQVPIFISEKEAELFFYTQVLTGDAGDNIKGLKGIGKVRAKKLLDGKQNLFIATAREYLKRGLKDQYRQTYRLIKLGL